MTLSTRISQIAPVDPSVRSAQPVVVALSSAGTVGTVTVALTLAGRTGSLRGERVELVPIEPSFTVQLAESAAVDRSSYQYTFVPDGADATAAYIDALIADREAGSIVPFAQRHVATGRLVGCTRFMELRWWRGRDDPDEVEIGGTWLGADVQRSAVNTESKLLMFTHAFETWGVTRVALCTDERNQRSRAALARIGATFEGVLHHHRQSWVIAEAGRPRNSALYAVTDGGWPGVKQRLVERLAERP